MPGKIWCALVKVVQGTLKEVPNVFIRDFVAYAL
jgi:hypothetical protein